MNLSRSDSWFHSVNYERKAAGKLAFVSCEKLDMRLFQRVCRLPDGTKTELLNEDFNQNKQIEISAG